MLHDSELWPADRASAAAQISGADERGVPFPALLRMSRLRLGWSQERCAEACRVSLLTYGNWERGKSAPRRATELPLSQEQVLALFSAQLAYRPRRHRSAGVRTPQSASLVKRKIIFQSNPPIDHRLPDINRYITGRCTQSFKLSNAT